MYLGKILVQLNVLNLLDRKIFCLLLWIEVKYGYFGGSRHSSGNTGGAGCHNMGLNLYIVNLI